MKRARAGGMAALRRRPAPGPRPKLATEQRAQLPDILAKGAEAYGFIGDVWTTARVVTVIKRIFGVRYHPAHVSRLVRQEGLSLQKPIRRASQRDEAQIAAWRAERSARPSSKAHDEDRTILFVDEAGFYLLPFVARTYAPRGRAPVLHTPLTRDHLAAISAITPDGRLFTHVQTEAFRGPAIVAFLRQLLRQVRGKLLVIWDGCPATHRTSIRTKASGICSSASSSRTAAARTWTSCAESSAWPSAAFAAPPSGSSVASASAAMFTHRPRS